jgi:hypothetical protein
MEPFLLSKKKISQIINNLYETFKTIKIPYDTNVTIQFNESLSEAHLVIKEEIIIFTSIYKNKNTYLAMSHIQWLGSQIAVLDSLYRIVSDQISHDFNSFHSTLAEYEVSLLNMYQKELILRKYEYYEKNLSILNLLPNFNSVHDAFNTIEYNKNIMRKK